MKAIVYVSETGHTARYAAILGEKTGLPVYALAEAAKALPRGTEVIYLGWLFASKLKGYKKASKRFRIRAVCAVGLCDTGTAIPQTRKANAIPSELPLFTVQGGMDKTALRGINRFMLDSLIKMLNSKKERGEDDERMLYLLLHDEDYVCEENLSAVLEWFRGQN